MLHFLVTVAGLRWFSIGSLAGAMLGLAALIALYASPWRVSLYLHADPKVLGLRDQLAEHQEKISQSDIRMAQSSLSKNSGLGNTDSMMVWQHAQQQTWQEIKFWRTRLGEMAKAHIPSSPRGFANWTLSLLLWVVPGLAFFTLGGGVLSFFLGMRRQAKKPYRNPLPRRAQETPAPAGGMDQFQEAVRRIADIQARSPLRQKPTPGTQVAAPQMVEKEPRSPKVHVLSPFASQSMETQVSHATQASQAIQTSPVPVQPDISANISTDIASDTAADQEKPYSEFLSGWDEGMENGPLNPVGLTMQDEDIVATHGHAQAALPLEDNPYALAEDPPWGQMPATTEFEKLERQKDEVVKLARRGLTSSEISQRLKMSQDQVDLIIRMRRERR